MALISPFVFLVCILVFGSQCSSNSNGSRKWTSNLFKNRPLTTNPDFSYPGLFLADDGREAKEMWNSSKLLCEDEHWSSCAKYGRPVSITLTMIDITIPPPAFERSNTASPHHRKSAVNATQPATVISIPPLTLSVVLCPIQPLISLLFYHRHPPPTPPPPISLLPNSSAQATLSHAQAPSLADAVPLAFDVNPQSVSNTSIKHWRRIRLPHLAGHCLN